MFGTRPKTFKAAVLRQLGEPLEIREDLLLPPLREGQVLVQISFAGICQSQLMEVRGRRGADKYLPHLLGHEGTGEVIEVGADVTKVKPGDRVVLSWIRGMGKEEGGTRFDSLNGAGLINGGAVTTFSNYSIVSENRCFLLPDNVPMNCGVLLGCSLLTGGGMILNEAFPTEKDVVAIWGLGGIGMSALLTTALFKCAKIIAIDLEERKLMLAREFGATHLINASKVDPLEEIGKITEGHGVDIAIEASGMASVIEKAFSSVRNKGGKCLFASHPSEEDVIRIRPYDLICGKEIRGSWGGASQPDRDIPKFAELYRDRRLPLEQLLSEPYSLDNINQAMSDLESRKINRALIDFTT